MLMDDLRGRLGEPGATDDRRARAYLQAVEEAFGADIDYAMLVKLYGEPPSSTRSRAALQPVRVRRDAQR